MENINLNIVGIDDGRLVTNGCGCCSININVNEESLREAIEEIEKFLSILKNEEKRLQIFRDYGTS